MRYTQRMKISPNCPAKQIRSPKSALNHGCAPDAVRILVDDKYESPIEIRFVHNIFEYIF